MTTTNTNPTFLPVVFTSTNGDFSNKWDATKEQAKINAKTNIKAGLTAAATIGGTALVLKNPLAVDCFNKGVNKATKGSANLLKKVFKGKTATKFIDYISNKIKNTSGKAKVLTTAAVIGFSIINNIYNKGFFETGKNVQKHNDRGKLEEKMKCF